jgi:hypothetical protein
MKKAPKGLSKAQIIQGIETSFDKAKACKKRMMLNYFKVSFFCR